MFNVRIAGDHLYLKMAVHLTVAGDVFDGLGLWCPFSHELSWMRSETELSQFRRIFAFCYLLLHEA